MDDWWFHHDHNDSLMDDIYEEEFGELLNPFNHFKEDDDDEPPDQSTSPVLPQSPSQSQTHSQLYPQTQSQSTQSQLIQSQTQSQAQLQTQSQTQSINHQELQQTKLKETKQSYENDESQLPNINLSYFSKLHLFYFQQVEMVNPVFAALILGILLIIYFMLCDVYPYIRRLRMFSSVWVYQLNGKFLTDTGFEFLFFLVEYFIFLYWQFLIQHFYFLISNIINNLKNSNLCANLIQPLQVVNPVLVASVFGIGYFCFFIIQLSMDVCSYDGSLRPIINVLTNIGLEFLHVLILLFLCCFYEMFGFCMFIWWYCKDKIDETMNISRILKWFKFGNFGRGVIKNR